MPPATPAAPFERDEWIGAVDPDRAGPDGYDMQEWLDEYNRSYRELTWE